MSYDLAWLPLQTLLKPVSDAGVALARLDERIVRSPVGAGFLERSRFAAACASLWIDGELVHLEDLVLRDATKDIRTPTHELTITRDVLRSRRRISAQPPAWALSPDGLRSLRGQTSFAAVIVVSNNTAASAEVELPAADGPAERGEGENGDDGASVLDAVSAAIDAVLVRSEAAIEKARAPNRSGTREKDPLVYDLD